MRARTSRDTFDEGKTFAELLAAPISLSYQIKKEIKYILKTHKMKSYILICLFIFLAFSQLKAQTQKTIEGHSEVKPLKVDVNNANQVSNSGKKEGDTQGPMVLVDKPKDFEEFQMNVESNTKGLRPVLQVQITGSATDPSGVKVISVGGSPAELKAKESRETSFSATINGRATVARIKVRWRKIGSLATKRFSR